MIRHEKVSAYSDVVGAALAAARKSEAVAQSGRGQAPPLRPRTER